MKELGDTGYYSVQAMTEAAEHQFVELNGIKLPVRDIDEFNRQRDRRSSDEFLGDKFKMVTAQDVKQRAKRQARIQETFEHLVDERVVPTGPKTMLVKDEQFQDMHQKYIVAAAKGEGPQHEFQPLNTYAHKITRARPLFKGEVGMIGSTIVCLEAGYGTGNFLQVPRGKDEADQETTSEEVEKAEEVSSSS